MEERLAALLRSGTSVGRSAKQVSSEFGVRKKSVYDVALSVQASLRQDGPDGAFDLKDTESK